MFCLSLRESAVVRVNVLFLVHACCRRLKADNKGALNRM